MTLRRGLTLAVAAMVLPWLLVACGGEVAGGPPEISYGEDVCSSCGMIISDERFASAIVREGRDQPPLIFDDVGCMLAYEREHSIGSAARYFHDTLTRRWITDDQAMFVKTSRETPMGSGLYAVVDHTEAMKLVQEEKLPQDAVRSYSQLRQSATTSPHGH